MHATETLKIAQDRDLSIRLLDEVKLHESCPGFSLFEVTIPGERLLMAADDASGIGTRLFFKGIDDRRVDVKIERIDLNPDVAEWERVNNYR